MSNNGDNPKKPASSFALLSQRMNEVQKSKKPNQVTSFKSISKAENSPPNLNRSNSPTTINLEEENMSPPRRSESQSEDRDPNVPDRSYGDYFCPLCDSHMNSDAMWVAHITGKRHLKNVDKGSNDTKYDDLDVESCIKQEIKNVKDPVIGLSYIHEIRRKDTCAPPIFTCFLCQATFPTAPLTIEHVLTMKHRMNFMKENSTGDYQLLEATNLKKGHMEPLVEEMTLKLEQKYGRGAVKVKQEKLKIPPSYTYSAKRLLGTDDDEEKHPRRNLKYEDKDNAKDAHFSKNKKTNVYEKDKYERDVDRRKRYSSSEDEDAHKRDMNTNYSKRDRNTNYSERDRNTNYSERNVNTNYSKSYESSYSRDTYKRDSFHNEDRGESRSQGRKAVSPLRSYHPRSPPRREPIKENYKIPYGPEPPFQSSRSHQYNEKASSSLSQDSKDNSQILGLKEFVQQIIVLPPEIFFKIVNIRLDKLEFKNVEELTLVSQLIQKCQEVLCKKLPPEIQAVINQKLTQSSANVPSAPQPIHQGPSVPQPMHQVPSAPQPMHQIHPSSIPNSSQPGDLSFIKEFLDHRKSSVVPSSIPSTITSPVGGGVGIPPPQTPSYASQSYASSSQTYVNYQSSVPQRSNLSVNYASSYQNNSFNNATSSNSSGIPGLTLDEENRERQNYSYGMAPPNQSHYPSYGY